MENGFIGLKLMAAAPAFGAPGDIKKNLAAILDRVAEAGEKGAELLLLPELCLTAFSCGDLLCQPLLLEAAERAAATIAEASNGLLCVFGLPVMREGRLYSAMLAARNGRLIACWLKELNDLTHDEVKGTQDKELPSFVITGRTVPVYNIRPFPLPGRENILVGLSLCKAEDSPGMAKKMIGSGISLALFPSAEPALAGNAAARQRALALASQNDSLCLYANAGANESTTDFVCDGLSVIAYKGSIVSIGRPFKREAAFAAYPFLPIDGTIPVEDLPPDTAFPYAPPQGPQRAAWCLEALEIGAQALACRMERIGAKTLTLGISGGLDSAMALLFARRSFEILKLDKAGIMAISLPGPGSSDRTRRSARSLVEALGLSYREIDITPSLQLHLRDIGHSGVPDAAFENAQARERTQILMDRANMHGGIMLGTGDMSEAALGFTTYGGDHLSMYNPNGGLYKTAIRLIVGQVADDCESPELSECLQAILDTPISPELLPPKDGEIVQRTEEIVGPYELIDFYLYHFLVNQLKLQELLRQAQAAFAEKYTRDSLLHHMRGFFRRFFASQFKRSCQADGPQILSLSLSPRGGLAMPSDCSAALWLDEIDALLNTGE